MGLVAINDSYFLEMGIYSLLRRYVKGRPYYMDVTELFQQVSPKIQSLEGLTY